MLPLNEQKHLNDNGKYDSGNDVNSDIVNDYLVISLETEHFKK